MEILSIGASGMVAAGQAVRIRANNIVNAYTPDYRPQAPVFSPLGNRGGVAVFAQEVGQPVNFLTETLGLKTAANLYQAAASIVRRGDEMRAALFRALA